MSQFAPRHKPFANMTPPELRQWLQEMEAYLQRKVQREQEYLNYRARQGRRTPTDEVYEQDILVEKDILEFLHAAQQDTEDVP